MAGQLGAFQDRKEKVGKLRDNVLSFALGLVALTSVPRGHPSKEWLEGFF
jgi:hypothetical protein